MQMDAVVDSYGGYLTFDYNWAHSKLGHLHIARAQHCVTLDENSSFVAFQPLSLHMDVFVH